MSGDGDLGDLLLVHDDIKNGGVLELVMGDVANKSWGTQPQKAPPSVD